MRRTRYALRSKGPSAGAAGCPAALAGAGGVDGEGGADAGAVAGAGAAGAGAAGAGAGAGAGACTSASSTSASGTGSSDSPGIRTPFAVHPASPRQCRRAAGSASRRALRPQSVPGPPHRPRLRAGAQPRPRPDAGEVGLPDLLGLEFAKPGDAHVPSGTVPADYQAGHRRVQASLRGGRFEGWRLPDGALAVRSVGRPVPRYQQAPHAGGHAQGHQRGCLPRFE
mmetsp:Transcript_23733/g.75201  ORF Transcript_23733/g.75201 Transcript_23733/m.75201 type:complete len:225 (-) Transcript_23733:1098-1772(-)